MSSHDLIFSNRPSYRISRHAIFWLFWLLFCYIFNWLPTSSRVFEPFYSSWNIEELLQRIDKRGGWYDSLIWQFFDRWYKGFLVAMVSTYIIIYSALPGFFSRKKNKTSTLITLLLIVAVLIYCYISYYTALENAFKRG